jgi:ribosomal protein S18 acetylase RimI-like enzyme
VRREQPETLPSGVRLRPAVPADADACARLALEPPGGLHLIVADGRTRFHVARRTFAARGTGFGWERSLVADGGGSVVAMVARFPDTDWPRLRIRTGAVMLAAAGPRYAIPLLRRGRIEERAMAPIGPGRMYVMSLAVDPARRGEGIGAKLLARVCEEARADGLRAVALDVSSDNERAIRFYRREGFTTVSEARVPATRSMPVFGMVRMERTV